MQLILFWVEGHTPMLQHRATEEALGGKTRRQEVADERSPREICEAAIYRTPGGQLAFPGPAVARMLREAGGARRGTARCGAVRRGGKARRGKARRGKARHGIEDFLKVRR
jgi:hypothetical protein